MWSANDSMTGGDFGNGGGFYNSSKFDSPGTGKKQQTKRAQSVTPVVVGMIKNSQTEEFTMWGNPTTILKLVCIIRKFDVTSTTVTYEIEDHTGSMNAILWLEHESGSSPNIPVDKENIYVKVFGTLRTKGDEKLIMILKIAPIDYMNEITCHMLETIFVRVFSEKNAKGEAQMIKVNNPGAELSNSMMSYGGVNEEEQNLNPFQKKVLQCIKTNKTDMGISREDVYKHFSPNLRRDIDAAINHLTSEGYIFSTIDNDHFQLTTE